MKKLTFILIVATLVLSLCACSKSEAPKNDVTPAVTSTPAVTAEPEPTKELDVVTPKVTAEPTPEITNIEITPEPTDIEVTPEITEEPVPTTDPWQEAADKYVDAVIESYLSDVPGATIDSTGLPDLGMVVYITNALKEFTFENPDGTFSLRPQNFRNNDDYGRTYIYKNLTGLNLNDLCINGGLETSYFQYGGEDIIWLELFLITAPQADPNSDMFNSLRSIISAFSYRYSNDRNLINAYTIQNIIGKTIRTRYESDIINIFKNNTKTGFELITDYDTALKSFGVNDPVYLRCSKSGISTNDINEFINNYNPEFTSTAYFKISPDSENGYYEGLHLNGLMHIDLQNNYGESLMDAILAYYYDND